jgi:hypothetical protein
MVAIVPKGDAEMAVLLRVYPMEEVLTLPPGLELKLLDEKGNLCGPIVRARGINESVLDQFVQLKFYGKMGSQFSVQVIINAVSLTRNFIM